MYLHNETIESKPCITSAFYRMIVSCLGGLVFHSVGYYLILLWMSISIGFFMVTVLIVLCFRMKILNYLLYCKSLYKCFAKIPAQ